MAHGKPREVRLGLFAGVPTRILPRALLAFERRHPDISVNATEAATDTPLYDLLQEGEIDLAFTCLPGEEGPFDTCEILRVPWVLVVRADTELGTRSSPLSIAELSGLALIGAATARLRPALENGLCTAGAPRIVFRSDMAETALGLAAAGVGAAVLPRLAVDGRDPRLRLIDLDDLVPPMILGLAWQRQRRLPGAVEEFRDLVQELCRTQAPGRRFDAMLGSGGTTTPASG
jgi:DNA-binding transcriptional LysR family regulator